MHKSATKCNETIGKWCKNKDGKSKIIDTLETYHLTSENKNKKQKDIIAEYKGNNSEPKDVSSFYLTSPATAPEKSLMSMHTSVLVDSVRPPSAEVCRTTASFP
jgi:hypothetical protein